MLAGGEGRWLGWRFFWLWSVVGCLMLAAVLLLISPRVEVEGVVGCSMRLGGGVRLTGWGAGGYFGGRSTSGNLSPAPRLRRWWSGDAPGI